MRWHAGDSLGLLVIMILNAYYYISLVMVLVTVAAMMSQSR